MKVKAKDRRLKPIDDEEFASQYPQKLRQERQAAQGLHKARRKARR
jgi:hypothetical protein